jgi:protein-L-isoaspartate(D-aspartate) O-methyltransferase
MINGQILPNKVTSEAVTEALMGIPREQFLPKALRGVAYLDADIALGEGRYLMEPVTFARLLQAAEIDNAEIVLDVGCASGYSSAVLSRLAGCVVALESDEAFVAQANRNLAALEIDNVAVVSGQLTAGYPGQAPYDVIFLNGSAETVPAALLEQLAEGGRMLLVRAGSGVGNATRTDKSGGVISERELFDANIAPLPGFQSAPGFVF